MSSFDLSFRLAVFLLCASLLPLTFADSHSFAPPQEQWIQEKNYLKDQGDGEASIAVQPQDRTANSRYAYEIRYFRDQKAQLAGDFCKVLRYDASGRLRGETDREGQDTFSRSFYPGGLVASYEHWNKTGRVEGYSEDPSSKRQSRFFNGNGELTLWEDDARHFKILWIYGGKEYLSKKFTGKHCDKTVMYNPLGDTFTIAEGEEMLVLSSRHEVWIREKDGAVSAQIMDSIIEGETVKILPVNLPEDAIKKHIRQSSAEVRRPVREDPNLQKQLAKDYETHRHEFIYARLYDIVEKSGANVGKLRAANLTST